MKQLLSIPTRVESPFIIVKVGEYTFGKFIPNVTFPNYMKSISITKVNGAVNTYNISLVYAITPDSDPNRLEKIFGSISEDRKIKISYGDCNAPSFVYKEEEAIITKITTSMSAPSSQISYAITATSTALYLTASKKSFEKKHDKPSNVIISLLDDKSTGLVDIFPGMRNSEIAKSNGWLPVNDKIVDIEAKRCISMLDYLNYLVSCMVPDGEEKTADGVIPTAYYLTIIDDSFNEFGGGYFKITGVRAETTNYDQTDTYELDVGYPGDNLVTSFSILSDDSWSILYNYSGDSEQYAIDNYGDVTNKFEKEVTLSSGLMRSTQANINWWAKMTAFPITASITIKGLLRPAILMSKVLVNVYFYGRKHISSGLYIITEHKDTVDQSGYRTTLSLTRIGGDSR